MLVGRRLTLSKELRADIEQFYVDVVEKSKLKSLLTLCRCASGSTRKAHHRRVIFCNADDIAQLLENTFILEGIVYGDDEVKYVVIY